VDDDHPTEGCLGDWVLVHVGFAMSRIDAQEAAETLRILTELGEAQAELEGIRSSNAEAPPAQGEDRP
jgi:hydrogenase expression/formation protein HypC